MCKKKAIVLLSGGIDSTTTLAVALSQGYEVVALSFDYGQRHKRELECARKIAEYYEVGHVIVRAPLSGSALTDKWRAIPERKLEEIGEEIPPTYVPARNILMLSYALAYAEIKDANTIFIGANVLDYSGYPDCRPAFLRKFEEAANLGTKKGLEEGLSIHYPLIMHSKAEIIKKGIELHVPYHLTWSCYRGEEKACGRCDSCQLRLKGFREAGVEDPIEYVKS